MNIIDIILVLAAILFILDYFGVRSEHWRKTTIMLVGNLHRLLLRVLRRYVYIHPYVGIIVAILLVVTSVVYTYMLLTNGEYPPLGLLVIRWVITVLYAITVPTQIRRIRGERWPPKF